MRSTVRRAQVTLLLVASSAAPALAQERFPQTLHWGSGLIDVPVAWVAPTTGDFSIQVTRQTLGGTYQASAHHHGAAHVALFGRAELGLAAFSRRGQWGVYGSGLLLDERAFRDRQDAMRWAPSVAVGFRNLGPYERVDRFGLGYGGGHTPDAHHVGFRTSPTLFIVATRSFAVEGVQLSGTLGAGNGLFSDDGDHGSGYGRNATGGVFGGLKADYLVERNTVVSLLAEHNAWDFNLGVSVSHRMLNAGLHWMGMSARGSATSTDPFDYRRIGLTLGMHGNVVAMFRKDEWSRRRAEVERERAELLAGIEKSRTRVSQLESALGSELAQNLLEQEPRYEEAGQALRSERLLLQHLEERLRVLDQQRQDPSRSGR